MLYKYLCFFLISFFCLSFCEIFFAQSEKWFYEGESVNGNQWYYKYNKDSYKGDVDYDIFWVKVVYKIKPTIELSPPFPADTIQFSVLFYKFNCKENQIKTQYWRNYYRQINSFGEEEYFWDTKDDFDDSWRKIKPTSMEGSILEKLCK